MLRGVGAKRRMRPERRIRTLRCRKSRLRNGRREAVRRSRRPTIPRCGSGVLPWGPLRHPERTENFPAHNAAPHTLGDAASAAQPAAGTASAVPSGASSAWESDPADAASAERAGRMVSGRTYVVQGVYSTERNALRAARAASEAGGEAVRCGVYRFGDKFMVSLFETDDAAAAAAFVRTHAGRFPETWPYKAR